MLEIFRIFSKDKKKVISSVIYEDNRVVIRMDSKENGMSIELTKEDLLKMADEIKNSCHNNKRTIRQDPFSQVGRKV